MTSELRYLALEQAPEAASQKLSRLDYRTPENETEVVNINIIINININNNNENNTSNNEGQLTKKKE